MKPITPFYLLMPLVSTMPAMDKHLNLSFNASAAIDLSGMSKSNLTQLRNVTDEILFHADLNTFIATRNSPHETYELLNWVPNECLGSEASFFGFDFAPACLRHIWGYTNYALQKRLDRHARHNIGGVFRIDSLHLCKDEKHVKTCSVVSWFYRTKMMRRHRRRVERLGGVSRHEEDEEQERIKEEVAEKEEKERERLKKERERLNKERERLKKERERLKKERERLKEEEDRREKEEERERK